MPKSSETVSDSTLLSSGESILMDASASGLTPSLSRTVIAMSPALNWTSWSAAWTAIAAPRTSASAIVIAFFILSIPFGLSSPHPLRIRVECGLIYFFGAAPYAAQDRLSRKK